MSLSSDRSRARVVHLSDLHFGTVRPRLVEPLLGLLDELAPTVVVVSGDLTQRAKDREFRAAADFLHRISLPKVVTPGNHDIPFWNVWARFAIPLDNYREHISKETEPSYQDADLLVISLNTARSFTFKGGAASDERIDSVRSRLGQARPEKFKVVVMHHPLLPLTDGESIPAVDRSRELLEVLEETKTDVVLSGHCHHRHIGFTRGQNGRSGHSVLVVHAGTALSDRTRGATNSFNVLDFQEDSVTLTAYEWREDLGQFAAVPDIRFEGRGYWKRVTD